MLPRWDKRLPCAPHNLRANAFGDIWCRFVSVGPKPHISGSSASGGRRPSAYQKAECQLLQPQAVRLLETHGVPPHQTSTPYARPRPLFGVPLHPRCPPAVLTAQPSSNEARYAFIVEWYDPTASLIRQYQLIYYASDGTLEMVRAAR